MSIKVDDIPAVNVAPNVKTAKYSEQNFSDILNDKVNKDSELQAEIHHSFGLESSPQVMEAWDKTLSETGIDPFPMNRISTVFVVLFENGIRKLTPRFLGDDVSSAVAMVKKIIYRLENPLVPRQDKVFEKNEMIFYNKLLDNLRCMS